MSQKQHKLQIALWIFAVLAIFIFITIVGWRVFYGFVVPQVNNLETFSIVGLFIFAALAGLAVNLGPCSLAVLPAYMSFFLGMNGHHEKIPLRKSVKLGAIASSGVVAFYLVLGVLFATIGPKLAAYAPQLKLFIAFVILVLGIMLLRGWSIEVHAISDFKNAVAKKSRGKSAVVNLMGFGVVYGAGGLSCFLPVFLPLVFYPFAGGQFFESIVSFAIFAAFQALFLIGATVLVGLGKDAIIKKMVRKADSVKKIAGIILILTSLYMFGVFIYLGM